MSVGAWVVSGLLWPVTALCFGSSNKIPCLRGTGFGLVYGCLASLLGFCYLRLKHVMSTCLLAEVMQNGPRLAEPRRILLSRAAPLGNAFCLPSLCLSLFTHCIFNDRGLKLPAPANTSGLFLAPAKGVYV